MRLLSFLLLLSALQAHGQTRDSVGWRGSHVDPKLRASSDSASGKSQIADSLEQGGPHAAVFQIEKLDTIIQLTSQFILTGTDSIRFDSTVLRRNVDYILDSRFGKLQFSPHFIDSVKALPRKTHALTANYSSLPFTFKKVYRRHEPVIKRDTVTGTERKVIESTSPFTLSDIFGANVEKSGSLVRGLSVGSNRDLTLTSGFHMQMSGKVSDDLTINAALTDENIPIQPEGTTQQLQEVDKVYVELEGRNVGATLGDFTLGMSGSEFANLDRKLQGAEGTAHYRDGDFRGTSLIAVASARGKFTTNAFQGIDGVEGPYILYGANNERDIIVIAGTEHVYLDGEQLTRGSANDYTIDYSNSQITFTSKRLIANTSRITVDFEYSDNQFNRSLFAAQSQNTFFGDRVRLNINAVREADDPNNPISTTLSDTDKGILNSAGNNRNLAVKTGADSVGAGKGQYIRFDTVVVSPITGASTSVVAYRYNPEDTLNALFAVTFSFVGNGLGSYNEIATGYFQFVGPGYGGYEPIQFLPLPQSHNLGDVGASVKLTNEFSFAAEGAMSQYDQNLLSSIQKVGDNGGAYKVGFSYDADSMRIGGAKFGALHANVNERYVNQKFSPIDRVNTIEFSRDWDITDTAAGNETMREASLQFQPVRAVTLTGTGGSLEHGDFFDSRRYTLGGKFQDAHAPTLEYNSEILSTTTSMLGANGNWVRDNGRISDTFGIISPALKYAHEYRNEQAPTIGTVDQGSYRFVQWDPQIGLKLHAGFLLNTGLAIRSDDSLIDGTFQHASNTLSQHYDLQSPQWEPLSSSVGVTLRKIQFTPEFISRSDTNNSSLLLRAQARSALLNRGIEADVFYEAASERTAKEQRVFQQVPVGTGNYVYLGDVNHNHVVDEQDFQLSRFDGNYISFVVPSSDLVPITDLKTNGRLRINGSRLWPARSSFSALGSLLSTETNFSIAEKSSDPSVDDIYFFHPGKFLSDLYTLDGSNILTQDVFINENDPAFSTRFRFDQKKGFTQYSLDDERTYAREQSIRVKWHLVEEIANQIDYIHQIDNLSANEFSLNARGVTGNSLVMDWSYRPEKKIELGFTFDFGQSTNYDTTIADMNDQSVRLVYSIETKGQARVEFTRNEVLLTKAGLYTPYQLTEGKVQGKTYLWKLALDYRLTDFMQGTFEYEGRIENVSAPINTGRAEVRAYF